MPTTSVSIAIDVPDLAEAIRFYTGAFGFTQSAAPFPGVVVLQAGNAQICLLEKRAGSQPSPHTQEQRHYERHWTPVHLDIHVDDLDVALARAVDAGAKQEQVFRNPAHGSAAFCSDPFGHGFCLIERKH
ncbi:MAG: VOC family protein [Rudaea sp.]